MGGKPADSYSAITAAWYGASPVQTELILAKCARIPASVQTCAFESGRKPSCVRMIGVKAAISAQRIRVSRERLTQSAVV